MRLASEDKAGRQYLERYAEPEARSLPVPGVVFDNVVVIPARGEGDCLFEALASVPGGGGRRLVILVLNAASEDSELKHSRNAAVRKRFGGSASPEIQEERGAIGEFSWSDLAPGRALLLIDRAKPGRFLPARQGVGLARKIGCDVALALHRSGHLRSRFIHCTDADALVPEDYFERAKAIGARLSALVYPMTHQRDEDPRLALGITLYESFLRYHRLGLHWAGSPFAYQAIGSTLAIDAVSYAQVRGFPRTMAGEDFYLLDKLAKLGEVYQLSGAPIQLRGRVSDRVPFGTGRALMDYLNRGEADYRLPDPEVYVYLRAWMSFLNDLSRATPGVDLRRRLADHVSTGAQTNVKTFVCEFDLLVRALDSLGAFQAVQAACELKLDAKNLRRRFHTWFDAFRTLKFLHGLRDFRFQTLPFEEAIARAPFLNVSAGDPEVILERLKEEESFQCGDKSCGVVAPAWL